MKNEAWGPGPWDDEPDHVEWRAHGLPCLLHRQPSLGHWCGYVAVPPGHPAHGKDYACLDMDVHGGLTYAESCSGNICHVPEPGEPNDVWWLGFDCAHLGDLSPATAATGRLSGLTIFYEPEATYRDLAYVRNEAEALAAQLAEMKPETSEET